MKRSVEMGLFRNYISQTRKLEGFLGKMMLSGMNTGMPKWLTGAFPICLPSCWRRRWTWGCGGGRNAGELLKKYPKAQVTAIDYSELSVAKAKEYNKEMIAAGRCTVRQGDVSDLQLPKESFDLATAFETIYFWPGLEACFAQVFRVLKPGGRFMICNESDGTDAASLRFEKIIDGMKNYTAEQIETALKRRVFRKSPATIIRQNHGSL